MLGGSNAATDQIDGYRLTYTQVPCWDKPNQAGKSETKHATNIYEHILNACSAVYSSKGIYNRKINLVMLYKGDSVWENYEKFMTIIIYYIIHPDKYDISYDGYLGDANVTI